MNNLGFFSTLTIVLVALKLLDVISWSWWWVFAPLWVPALFLLGLLIYLGGDHT